MFQIAECKKLVGDANCGKTTEAYYQCANSHPMCLGGAVVLNDQSSPVTPQHRGGVFLYSHEGEKENLAGSVGQAPLVLG